MMVFANGPQQGASEWGVVILLGRFGSGGVERVSCLLANGFSKHGWNSQIWVADNSGPTQSLVHEGVEIRALLPGSNGGRKFRLLLSIPRLAWQIRRSRPAVLLSPGNHTHLAAGLAHALAGRKDVRLVVKQTNPVLKDWHQGTRRKLKHHFYRWLYRRADQVLVLSRDSIADVHAQAGRSVETKFVHNPYIQTIRTAAARAKDGPPIILAVGRFSRQKNFGLLLDALAKLLNQEWRLILLGEGPEGAMLREKVNALGIADRVEFAGYVVDPIPYYDRAHCLVLSSLWEDLPAVALEAMGVGCPVVATDCSPALSDIIRATGFGAIVPIDVVALSQAIVQILESPANRTIPLEIAAYSVENGVDEHVQALAPLVKS
jgi:glycosyltransferase involved in cell wall biosynthesis